MEFPLALRTEAALLPLWESSEPSTKALFLFVGIGTLIQWIMALIRIVKWASEFVCDCFYIREVVAAPPPQTPPQCSCCGPQGVRTVHPLKFEDAAFKVHLNKECHQLKGATPDFRIVCKDCSKRADKRV